MIDTYMLLLVMFFSMQIGAKIRHWVDGIIDGVAASIYVFVYGAMLAWAAKILIDL
jgi:hypothetical protein